MSNDGTPGEPQGSPPGLRQVMSMVRQENGIASLMQRPVYPKVGEAEPSVSQADVVADLFNLERLDVKRMADALDIEMEIQRMTPETAALLMQGLVKGTSHDLIERFNDLEAKRERVIAELVDDEELVEHRKVKFRVAYSQPDPADLPDEVFESEVEVDGAEEMEEDEDGE